MVPPQAEPPSFLRAIPPESGKMTDEASGKL
jgi:hypothetical protein